MILSYNHQKLFKNFIFVILFFGLSVDQLAARANDNQTVSGAVTSMKDEAPLPGVNIVEKGTSHGTISDEDRKYSLTVLEQHTLVFTPVGYNPNFFGVGNLLRIGVTMTPNVQQLQELVVVGYGTQQKKDLAGSISTVSSEDLLPVPTASFDQRLQGKAAGVKSNQKSGAPGGNVNILVRGISSITGGNQQNNMLDTNQN